jgi:hypothetical protein
MHEKTHCAGRAHVSNDNEVEVTKAHNHAPSPHLVRKKVVLADVRNEARTGAPRAVVNSAIEGIPDAVKANLPHLKNMQKNASRARKAKGLRVALPQSFDEVFFIGRGSSVCFNVVSH